MIEREGLNTKHVRRELIRHVREFGGDVVVQRLEHREQWADRYRFYYMVILPYHSLRHGLVVEMRLTGKDDPDFPEVTLVGAHPERR